MLLADQFEDLTSSSGNLEKGVKGNCVQIPHPSTGSDGQFFVKGKISNGDLIHTDQHF